MTRFARPLLVVAGDVDTRPALTRALLVAGDNHSTLTALVVTPVVPAMQCAQLPAGVLAEVQAVIDTQRKTVLDGLRRAAQEAGVELRITHRNGPPFLEVIREVLAGGHDLVLKSAGSNDRRTFDATDKHLLRKCPCPLWLVTPSAGERHDRILAAVDPDPGDPEQHELSVTVFESAAHIARMDSARLDVLHAWNLFGESLLRSPQTSVSDPEVNLLLGGTLNRHSQALDRLVDAVNEPGVQPNRYLMRGAAGEVIADFAAKNHVDLLVMGTVGRSGVPGLLIGNTAEWVIDEIACSLLAFKPRGFVSPVLSDA